MYIYGRMRKLSGGRPAVRGGFVFFFSPFVEGMGVGRLGHQEGGGQQGLEYCGSSMLSKKFDEMGLRLGFVFRHIANKCM